MGEFLIPVGIGFSASIAWFGIWVLVLRACGLVSFRRTSEEKARIKERILRMGKGRFILLFGVLGWGLPVGIGIEMSHVAAHSYQRSGGATGSLVMFVVWGLAGWWYGVRMWNASHQGEVPFPPSWLSQK